MVRQIKVFLKRRDAFLYQFPMDDMSSRQYLDDIYASIILKDIAQRNKVRDLDMRDINQILENI